MRLLNITPQVLDWILERASSDFEAVRGSRILFTGATGWMGKWLLSSLLHAQDRLNLGLRITALSRDPERFQSEYPQWADHPVVSWRKGDLLAFKAVGVDQFDQVLHAAAQPHPAGPADPIMRTQVDALESLLKVLSLIPPRSILFTSSGAAYGPFPPGVTHIAESAPTCADPPAGGSAYGMAKLRCEQKLKEFYEMRGTRPKLARCFAMVGAGIPLDGPYAMGNFIRDGLAGGPIRVSGDGTAHRSYLHMAEAVVWLLRIWNRGEPGEIYNVGSDESLSIHDAAQGAAGFFGCGVELGAKPAPGAAAVHYVPSIERAKNELGLRVEWNFAEALKRTVERG